MDVPNHRSSHTEPTPTAGGLSIVMTFFLGMVIIYLVGDETMISKQVVLGFTFSSLLIAAISFYDDYIESSVVLKLITQMFAILVIMVFGIVITRINIPFTKNYALGIWGYIFTFIWILGLTNAYNFMDGLNGMAGGNALVTSFFLGIIAINQGSNFTYIVCYTLIAGNLGFLIFNFPKGLLFMGDIGSTFLGFTFASLAIISSLYDNAHTSLLVIPLLLQHFIYDTLFTFIRRLITGKNVFKAHRTHLYQLFNRLGFSHSFVTLFYCAVGIIQGLGAFWMVNINNWTRIFFFIPFLIFDLIYSMVILYYAKRSDLLTEKEDVLF